MTDTERSFAAAMVAMQAELPRIGKSKTARVPTKSGGEYSYSYADLAVIVAKARPVVTRHGFAFIARPTTNARGDFVLAYELLHVSGEKREGEYPIWQQGDRPLTHQEKGSAITYGRRYCYCCATGIITDGDDDDAQAATARQRQPQRQARQREQLGPPPERAPGNLPRNRDGSISRSQATDAELDAAGVMTSAQQAEHTALRNGADKGRVNGVSRSTEHDPDDPWEQPPPPPLRAPRAAQNPAQAIAMHFQRLGVTDRDQRLRATARLAGRESIITTNDLTAAEGGKVKAALETCRDRSALIALLAEEVVDA